MRPIGPAAFLLVTIAAPTPSLAQVARPPAPPAAAGEAATTTDEAGDVVVTALRRQSTVQTTPIAISALGETQLSRLGATTIADVIRQVPGLQLTESDSGRTRVSIRGVQASGESTVGLYYGETPLTGPSGTNSDPAGNTPNLNLFDVERVEVLRGPQGTLYGSGSMGGTLRVLFNQPDPTTYAGTVELQASSTRDGGVGYVAKGALNVPIVADRLALRVVGYRERQPGFVDYTLLDRRDTNRATLEGGRAILAYTPSSAVTLTATALLQTQDIAGTSQYSSALGPYRADFQIFQPWHDKLQLYNGVGRFDLGFATLTASASWYRWDVESTNDNNAAFASVVSGARWCPLYTRVALGVPVTSCTAAQRSAYQAYARSKAPFGAYQPRYVRNFIQEARLGSNGAGPLTYTVGLFHEDRFDRVDTLPFAGDPITGGQRDPVDDLGGRNILTSVEQTAFFGELGYRLFAPLTLTVGLRHFDYTKTVGGAYLGYNFTNGQEPRAYEETTANAKGWVKKFNAELQLARDLLVYANAAQGFRPGGANNIPNLPAQYLVYRPDSLWNYELGAKTSWFGRRLTLNLAVYRTDWDEVQTSVSTLQQGGGNFNFIYNLAGVRVEGVELEASARPLRHLTLSGSVNYNDAKLTSDQVDSTGFITAPGRSGDVLTYVPRATAAAGIDYAPPIDDRFNGLFRLDYTYTGRMTTELRESNAFYRRIGDYSIVNARVGIEGRGFGAYVFASNLFNENGLNRVASATGTPDYYVSTRPRTIGVNLRQSF
ncbi:TonB-dependent receptor [Sphingomonas sp. BK580]|uniref:TonB-dependent receptor n=1 Tax=Sphingomonas sp. BK580 TaxID=2586972 RepID=UPI00160C1AF1|nr:TonB-dependent receptor [Sphingomonas sp. BK580]MBB3691851.1 outer membrane receptor protein involved in Fe transport [Sphingomonas sp. BK580]